ncbi:MAG: SprT family zinc-dependent metalloprotease, partial [Chloroflexi bacterium]|nr:SprT family zinc-dependent metalloprotease [Chloroflexota bacterium]
MRLSLSRPSPPAQPAAREYGAVAGDGFAIPYRVVRSARRRRTVELRLERDGVRVAAPLRTPSAEIEAFVRSRLGWIQKQLAKLPPPPRTPHLESGGSVPYLGRMLPLEVVEGPVRRPRVQLDLLGLRVIHPPVRDQERSAVVETALVGWYRARASEELPRRLQAWASRLGYAPSRVLVRDQKRRWGSCAPDGTIRLNWRLVMMPPDVADYVVIHELAPLRLPN